MYSLEGYGKMLADRLRMDAYLEALRRAVVPGCVVVDLGCGPGVFSLYACRWGARRVYAVEPGDVIQLARELASANGFADRIVTIRDLSTNVTLPEPADVIVADVRGIVPFYETGIASMIDARERLLAPGGVLIPGKDTIRGTVIEFEDVYRDRILNWDCNGFDMSAARQKAVNYMYKIYPKPEHCLAAPRDLAVIDYTIVRSTCFEAGPCWEVERSGTAHGLCLWFESELAAGVSLVNGPFAPALLYGSTFVPFERAVAVQAGDRVQAGIRADPVGNDYVWRWKTTVTTPLGIQRAAFSQSDFFATIVTREALGPPSALPGKACGP